jgi:predicted Zn-dependent protease with MMP-like domain
MLDQMSLEEFEGVVEETIKDLPAEFRKRLENVDVLVEIWPTLEDMQSIRAHPGSILFGLYRGIPQTKRGLYYSGVLPDKITIFAGPILSLAGNLEDAKTQIKKTVLHEIGHHFGMSEEDIRQAQF